MLTTQANKLKRGCTLAAYVIQRLGQGTSVHILSTKPFLIVGNLIVSFLEKFNIMINLFVFFICFVFFKMPVYTFFQPKPFYFYFPISVIIDIKIKF